MRDLGGLEPYILGKHTSHIMTLKFPVYSSNQPVHYNGEMYRINYVMIKHGEMYIRLHGLINDIPATELEPIGQQPDPSQAILVCDR